MLTLILISWAQKLIKCFVNQSTCILYNWIIVPYMDNNREIGWKSK